MEIGAEKQTSYLLSGLLRCGNCGKYDDSKTFNNWGENNPEYTDKKT
jgi:hypothetical protein